MDKLIDQLIHLWSHENKFLRLKMVKMRLDLLQENYKYPRSQFYQYDEILKSQKAHDKIHKKGGKRDENKEAAETVTREGEGWNV